MQVNSSNLTLKENGEYSITLAHNDPTQEFYDGNKKILAWHKSKDQLVIETFADCKINLNSNIKATKCIINSKGPLALKKLANYESLFIIATELDLATKINVKNLDLESQSCSIIKDVTINNHCMLKVRELNIGSQKKAVILQLPRNYNIHTGSLVFRNKSKNIIFGEGAALKVTGMLEDFKLNKPKNNSDTRKKNFLKDTSNKNLVSPSVIVSPFSPPSPLTQVKENDCLSQNYEKVAKSLEPLIIDKPSEFIVEDSVCIPDDAVIECKNIKIATKFLDTQGSLFLNHSDFFVRQEVKTNLKSHIKLNNLSNFSANERLESYGEIEAHNSKIFSANKLVAHSASITKLEQGATISAENMTLKGRLLAIKNDAVTNQQLSDAQIQKIQKFVAVINTEIHSWWPYLSNACVKMKKQALETFVRNINSNMEVSHAFELLEHTVKVTDGYLRMRTMMLIKDLQEEASKVQENIAPKMNVANKLHFKKTAVINGDENVDIEAAKFEQAGKINLSGNLTAKGMTLKNIGKIEVASAFLGFDAVAINYGLLSAPKISIQSNFINFLGRVYAKQKLESTGVANLNVGLICANNYTNRNLLVLNAGLIIPNFAADLRYIFSLSNLTSIAKAFLVTLLPSYTNLINLFFMVPAIYNAINYIYHNYKNFNLDFIRSLRTHEFMPLIFFVKDLIMFAFGVYSCARGVVHEFKILPDKTNEQKSIVSAPSARKDMKDMGKTVCQTISGRYKEESAIHIGLGFSQSCQSSQSSYLHTNIGTEGSILNHNISTRNFYNAGNIYGGETKISADEIYNSGTIINNQNKSTEEKGKATLVTDSLTPHPRGERGITTELSRRERGSSDELGSFVLESKKQLSTREKHGASAYKSFGFFNSKQKILSDKSFEANASAILAL